MSVKSFYTESPFVLQPHFQGVGAPLTLDGYENGTAANIPSSYSAEDVFVSSTMLTQVQVQVRDDGGDTTSVTTVGGGTWSRDESVVPKFSYLNMAMPVVGGSHQVTVTISTGGATRNQIIIIRRNST